MLNQRGSPEETSSPPQSNEMFQSQSIRNFKSTLIKKRKKKCKFFLQPEFYNIPPQSQKNFSRGKRSKLTLKTLLFSRHIDAQIIKYMHVMNASSESFFFFF